MQVLKLELDHFRSHFQIITEYFAKYFDSKDSENDEARS